MQTASKHVICRFMQKPSQFDCKHSLPYLDLDYQYFAHLLRGDCQCGAVRV